MKRDLDIAYVQQVVTDCKRTAENIRLRYKTIKRIRLFLDLSTVIFGIFATILTVVNLVPNLQIIDNFWSNVVTLTALALILTQVSVERLILKDPPIRYQDYSRYIAMYPKNIEIELAKSNPDWAKIEAWIEFANDNLVDAAANWRELVHESKPD